MTKFIAVIISFVFINFCFAQNEINKIDSIIKAASNLNPEIGVSFGFQIGDEVHYLNYGYTNRTGRIKIDKGSVFEIGSITKLFTAYLIAQQVELGRINLDDTIDDYLPPFFNLNAALKNKIKVSDLASHQSGIPDFDFQTLMATDPDQPLDQVTKELVDSILTNTSNLESYGSYQYSNISYVLLGYILENVTKNNYETIIKSDILIPLNMQQTVTSNFNDSNITNGYNAKGEQKDFFNWNSVIAPAGLLKSNSTDLLKFVRKLLASKNKVINTKLESTYFKNTSIELGLGLNIIRENGHVIFAKTGDTLGQSCVLAYHPEKNWGVVLLTNQANGTARKIFNQILDLLK